MRAHFVRNNDPHEKLGLTKYKDPKYKKIITDFMEWSGGYDPTETPWNFNDMAFKRAIVFLDSFISEKDYDDVYDFFEKLIDGDLDIDNYKQ